MNGFIGEIRMFAGNFAPRAWAFCEGQLLPIAQNTALFSILGTTYGGDGRTTFGLPDLRGRIAVHAGRGPGLTDRRLGSKGGSETNTLTQANLPNHSHLAVIGGSAKMPINAAGSGNLTDDPASAYYTVQGVDAFADSGTKLSGALQNDFDYETQNTGNNQPINNRQPYLANRNIICLQGTFPSRS